MPIIKALHVHLEGYTAFFKHPLVITGTQITLPLPPYSTILGMISACAGRVVTHKDTRIGFEFRSKSVGLELERTERLIVDKKGNLRPHPDGQGILKRYVHFGPALDLYLTNLELDSAFKSPSSTPSLGRSQDIMWITSIKQMDLQSVESGNIGPTMVPAIKGKIPSLIVRCPEWFDNNTEGRTRIVGPVGYYQAIQPSSQIRFRASMSDLYHPSDFENLEDVIYLHKWLEA